MFGERLLRGVDERIRIVALVDQLPPLFVVLRVLFGLAHHALDVRIAEPARRLDADLLFFPRPLVAGGDVDDAVRVDIEGDLDLRHAARRGGDADEIELSELLVVRRQFAFALEDPDRHRVLIVLRGRKGLALLGGDCGVPVDEAGEHAAQGLDAERQRRDVQQQHVLYVARQHRTLDGGADGDHLVGVDAAMRFAPEERLDRLHDPGDPGHAADEHDIVDFVRGEAGVLQRRAAGRHGALHQVVDQRLEFRPREFHRQVLRPRRIGGDIGQVDLGLRSARQFDLGPFRRFLEALQRQFVVAQVDAVLLAEFVGEIPHEPQIEILAAQERIAVGRLHLEHAVADLEDRDIERAAAEIVDGDDSGLLALEAVGERRRGGFVDDAQHFEAGDLTRILGRLALRVVEIGGNRDHRLRHRLAEVALGRLLHFLQDHRADLARRMGAAAGAHPGVAIVGPDDLVGNHRRVLAHRRVLVRPADQALDGEQRVLGIGDRLPLGGLADQSLILGESDH